MDVREYKSWREDGVAFKLRRDAPYEVPNRTLASGLLYKQVGQEKRDGWLMTIMLLSFVPLLALSSLFLIPAAKCVCVCACVSACVRACMRACGYMQYMWQDSTLAR